MIKYSMLLMGLEPSTSLNSLYTKLKNILSVLNPMVSIYLL